MTNDEKEIYLFAKKLYILYGDITIDIYKDEFWKYYENWKFSFSYLTFFRSKWFDGDVNDGYMEFSKKLIDTMREEKSQTENLKRCGWQKVHTAGNFVFVKKYS